MPKIIVITLFCIVLHVTAFHCLAESPQTPPSNGKEKAVEEQVNETTKMLTSLLELQLNTKEQIRLSQKKLTNSKSDAEKQALKEEISQLDRQLSETTNDFERIATGVESALFAEKKPETFSWKKELGSLIEPAIKELKRFTIRTRQKSDLKDKIVELQLLKTTAGKAVEHLQEVLDETSDNQVRKEIKLLQPEWVNVDKRLENKLELAQSELVQLEAQDVSLVESSSKSLRTFFKNRGLYLIVAFLFFVAILLICRVLFQAFSTISTKFLKEKANRSFKIRLFNIIFQVLSVIFAVSGSFFVLYLAEDWFLLSMAIIFFLGIAWTIRQGLPKLWQQARLMLNIGAVREDERLFLHGVPWRVASINVFSKLVNPSLGIELRVPIEDLIGLVSRPYNQEEPWFPCKKGDWVVVGSQTRARVVSLSHEQVEVVERGGRRVTYPTEAFLQACPANLSRNFRVKVPFGISYDLQKNATVKIPAILKEYIESKMIEEEYKSSCLNLQVEFFQANASSLDLLILADFEGNVANIYKRIQRALQKWCVDCCTMNNWEIPFPQLTVHPVNEELHQ